MKARTSQLAFSCVLLATALWTPLGGDAQEATFTLLGKSQPDEFYNGIGKRYIPLGEEGPNDVGQPKVNHDYVWSMAAEGSNIWFGTGANAAAQATALVEISGGQTPQAQEFVSPGGVLYRVWEFGESRYPGVRRSLRDLLGDSRPPKIYQFNTQTNQLIDRTPQDSNLANVIGLRAAGVHNGVAILCGQGNTGYGIYLFAFNAVSGKYLGSQLLRQYSEIRRFIVADGQLYTGVLNTLGYSSRGSVLRWTGSVGNPFSFQNVGNIDNAVAYLAYHDGRLFAGTWRSLSTIGTLLGSSTNPPACGVWMSPVLNGGLDKSDAGAWQKVWDPTFYEVEPGAVGGYAIGAMESFGNSLYFGTLHFPGQGTLAFQQTYGFPPPSPTSNSERTPIVVRARGYGSGSTPIVELVYGNTTLNKYNGSGGWTTASNATGQPATQGPAGFGNIYNRYIWSSSVYNGQLFFGTFDITGLSFIESVLDNPTGPPIGIGCDLWSFPSEGVAAVRQNRNGCGNPANHGVRNMVSTSAGLFLGMANSQNLLTNKTDNLPDGGWELLKLQSLVTGSTSTSAPGLPDSLLESFLEAVPPSLNQLD